MSCNLLRHIDNVGLTEEQVINTQCGLNNLGIDRLPHDFG